MGGSAARFAVPGSQVALRTIVFPVVLATLVPGLSTCDDAGTTVAPPVPCDLGPGDLRITEVMARPKPADPRIEWFELHNAGGRPLALAGVVLEAGSPTRPRTHRIPPLLDPGLAPGATLVVGNGSLDDGITAYAWPQMLLADDGATIAIRCQEVVVDRMSWGDAGSGPGRAVEGVSWQRSSRPTAGPVASDGPDPDGSQVPWCLADEDSVYDVQGDRGTPGGPNRDCPLAGECRDDDAWRALVTPAEGDLVITEVFANPVGADAPGKEWVEVVALRDADLNGLTLVDRRDGHERAYRIESTDCLRVRADDPVVLAGSTDPAANGGLPRVAYAFDGGLTLYNDLGVLGLHAADGVTIATAAPPASVEGASRSLRPDGTHAPAADSSPDDWCAGTREGRFEGLGTPGEPNEPCP
jgi:hypothetical protein